MASALQSKSKTPPPRSPAVQFDSQRDSTEERRTEKRIGTVYDAVAGRISSTGFIAALPFVPRTRNTSSSSTVAAAPEEVLFRRKRAPDRYEECDYYFANESLPSGHLPESDMLKALHCYASDFYSRAAPEDCKHDWRSMDETALLALGILMEELSKDSLGETGDLVFAEGETDAQDASSRAASAPSSTSNEGVETTDNEA